jgi:opacity protein-like surface antigen
MRKLLMNQILRYKRAAILLVFVAAILVSAAPTASADQVEADVVDRYVGQNSIEIQGGYFLGRREVFRDIYGNGPIFGFAYQWAMNDKVGLGVRLSWNQLEADMRPSDPSTGYAETLKYRNFAVIPTATYTVAKTDRVKLFAGGGLGVSFRKITWAVEQLSETVIDYGDSETSLAGLLLAGCNVSLSEKFYFGLRASYDRQFFGDVTTGDFGDTGGFNFGGSLGIRF